MNSLFFRKPDGIYYEGKRLKGVDVENFRILFGSWATDCKRVFFMWTVRNKLDPTTFIPLNYGFGKDGNRLVWGAFEVKNADPRTFEVLDIGLTSYERPGPYHWATGGYGRDSVSAYWTNVRLRRADPKSFQSFRNGYGADDRDVYCQEHRLKNADAKSWRYFGGRFSADTRSAFSYYTQIPECDPETMALLWPMESGWLRDKNNYFRGSKLSSEAEYADFLREQVSRDQGHLAAIESGGHDRGNFARLREYSQNRMPPPELSR